jgi:hypothetical protein
MDLTHVSTCKYLQKPRGTCEHTIAVYKAKSCILYLVTVHVYKYSS